MGVISKDLGAVTAYASAVEGGYTGTKEEFETLMASYATVAEEATESAESASTSATSASASAQTATTKASEASTSATQAGASATSASQSASTATAKASEASASATTASNKASEASASATTASSKASEASASATSAQTAQGLAESARDDAIDAKTDAENARDLAQQYAESIDPENIYSVYPTDTASGAVATFTDGADDIPMKSVKVAVEPVQSGSGDPSPDNVRPISGWTGAQVVRTGVNVWDEEWEVGSINATTGEDEPSNTIIRCVGYTKVFPNTTYYISTPNSVVVFFYDAEKNYIAASTRQNQTFTTQSNTAFIRFRMSYSYGAIYNHDISINYPSTDHDYHPYAGDTYSITFPSEAGTVYGGELDVTNGVLTVDRAMVDLGTLTWTYSEVRDQFRGGLPATSSASANNSGARTHCLCSIYKTSAVAYDDSDRTFMVVCVNAGYAWARDNRFTDPTAFKTAMDGVQFCYELATPTTYHLTPTEIKSLLGDNNVWADAGDTEVTYRADTAKYIDKKIAEVINALS